ncbi:hypothetical protein EII18_04650 [Comamonadaceae bacterium OH3737_COT-264]|uniref:hypothetical protein n=1 Tax=Allofranklinella schreckenbergeri TaxID=1076744 RepID=UPI000F5FC3D3|nr:hypothetical protein [Allofranklinella schreckenbergeri]RRD42779.1 hypothetical protein EII18_04650 [Comamonadaceae bacterium OH3737_COT-264]
MKSRVCRHLRVASAYTLRLLGVRGAFGLLGPGKNGSKKTAAAHFGMGQRPFCRASDEFYFKIKLI